MNQPMPGYPVNAQARPVEPPLQVELGAEALSSSVMQLHDAVEMLEARLRSLMVSGPAAVQSENRAPEPARSDLHARIAGATKAVSEATQRLNRIRASID